MMHPSCPGSVWQLDNVMSLRSCPHYGRTTFLLTSHVGVCGCMCARRRNTAELLQPADKNNIRLLNQRIIIMASVTFTHTQAVCACVSVQAHCCVCVCGGVR